MTLKGDKSEDPAKYIKFGMTKYHDYSKISVLGRGTYGEVTRCMHIHSGIEVAMKTFFFDVRILPTLFAHIECAKWYQLFYYEGDITLEKLE